MHNKKHKNVIKPKQISSEAKITFKKRVIVALILLVVFVPCLVLGGWFFFVLIALFIAAATFEIAKAPSRKLSWFVWVITFIIMYSLVYWAMLKTNLSDKWQNFDINTSFSYLWLSPFALAMMVIIYFSVVILKSNEFNVMDACYLISMTLIIALGFQAALCIRYFPFYYFGEHLDPESGKTVSSLLDITTPTFQYAQSMFLMIYVLLGIFFNDIGAYITGLFFGKHKMNPIISPNKTWEGFVGGVIISMILTLAFGMAVAYMGMPMLPVLSCDHWYWIVLISVALPLSANLGDFAFSAIKRQFNKKDYSHFLGPHGGILDRIDSTLFGAIIVVVLIIFISNSWNFLV